MLIRFLLIKNDIFGVWYLFEFTLIFLLYYIEMGEEEFVDTRDLYHKMESWIRVIANSDFYDIDNILIAINYVDDFSGRILVQHDLPRREYDINAVIDNLERIKNKPISGLIRKMIQDTQDSLLSLDDNDNDVAWDLLLNI